MSFKIMYGGKRAVAPAAIMLLGVAVCLLACSYARESEWWAPVMLACGILLGSLFYISLNLLGSNERRAQQLAADMMAAQQASEQRFRMLVEGVAEYAIFMLGADGTVASWNAGAQRINGYAEAEVLNRHISLFYPPEDVADGKPGMDLRMAAAEGRFEDEGWRLRKDGSRYWSNVVVTALYDGAGELIGFSKLSRDLSERREMEQQLAQANRLQQAILDFAPFAIISTNAEGVVRSANPAAERIFGQPLGDLLGKTRFASLFEPADVAARAAELSQEAGARVAPGFEVFAYKARQGYTDEREWNLMCGDGSSLPAHVSVTALRDGNGGLIGYSKLSRDLSERREMEQQLAQANRLQQAILDFAPFAIISTNAEGVVRSANPAAERMLGQSLDDLLGKTRFATLFEPADVAARAAELSHEAGRRVAPGFEVFAHNARQGLTDEREWNLMCGDGSSLPAHVTVTALRDGNGLVNGFLGIAYDITERKRRDEYTRHIAHHDAVTGLPNRVLLQDRLQMAMKRSRRDGSHIGVLMIDLDHFKRINDSLGHHIGDVMLSKIAERLGGCVRSGDTVARMGGDEFVVMLPEVTEPDSIKRIAASIVERVSAPIMAGNHELHVTPSVGVSVFPTDGQDVHTLLRHADMAMYQAKASGRRCFRVFSNAMERAAAEKLELEAAMRRALEREEFVVHYQPQVCLNSGRVVGVEALLRWNDALQGAVPPSRFIPVAEETGLIVPLGEWVLRTACRDAVRLQQLSGAPLRLAVNLSPRQFRQVNLQTLIEQALADSGLDPAHLEPEITEGVLMDSSDELAERLQRLRALGLAFAVDDFGTGYSSLSYITRFPIDTLKIDRSFVSRLPDSAGDAAVAQTIIALAHSLRIKVVGEGVESERQLDFLRARHCDMGQGFRFGKGGTVDDQLTQGFQFGEIEPWDKAQDFKGPPDASLQRLRVANS